MIYHDISIVDGLIKQFITGGAPHCKRKYRPNWGDQITTGLHCGMFVAWL